MLSGNINIEDNDWDSVRQGYAALTRDLERMSLSFGMGGNDFGGGVPKSANDQTVAQDGNYGYQAVTTDMLADLEARLLSIIGSIPVVTYPTSISHGGTGSTSASAARIALGMVPSSYTAITTPGSGTFTVPAGVNRILVNLIGGGGVGDASTGSFATVSGVTISDGVLQGGSGASIVASFDVVPGESISYVCGAKGVIGVSNGGASSISTADIGFSAGGGQNSNRGSSVGIGGSILSTLIPASRNPIHISCCGTNGGSSGSISGGGIVFKPSGIVNVYSPLVVSAAGALIDTLTGGGNWTASARNGAVVFYY